MDGSLDERLSQAEQRVRDAACGVAKCAQIPLPRVTIDFPVMRVLPAAIGYGSTVSHAPLAQLCQTAMVLSRSRADNQQDGCVKPASQRNLVADRGHFASIGMLVARFTFCRVTDAMFCIRSRTARRTPAVVVKR